MKTHRLQPGITAPDFQLPDQDGIVRRSGDFRGRPLALYFYPKASTPGCTTQSCNLRDAMPMFSELGCAVVGASPDPIERQKKFAEKYGLPFPLLADTDHAVAEAYGVWAEKSMYGRKYMGIVRSAFLIDAKGKIAAAFYRISPKDTVPRLQEALDAL